MASEPFTALAWIMAICAALMAGIYLAFSAVVLPSLATLRSSEGIAAMNAINRVILKTAFMPLFFGSTVIALLMVLTSLWYGSEPGAGATLVAGLVYIAGMFGVTAARNVPLNNRLAAVRGGGAEAEKLWHDYRTRWTRWNTTRAVCSAATLALCLDLLSR